MKKVPESAGYSGDIHDKRAMKAYMIQAEAEVNADMAEYEEMMASVPEKIKERLLSLTEPETVWRRHEAKGFSAAITLVKPKLEKKRNSEDGAKKALRARYAKRVWTPEAIQSKMMQLHKSSPAMPPVELVGVLLYRIDEAVSASTVYKWTKSLRDKIKKEQAKNR